MYRLTVGKSGNEDYYYLEEAINAVPYNVDAEIIIKEGIYREKIFSDKKNLRIIGEGNVLITYSDSGKEMAELNKKRGTFRSYSAFFSGEAVYIENVTIENSAGSGDRVGQAVALYLDADYAYLKNVKLLGHQDTLFIAPLPGAEREAGGFYGPRSFLPRKKTKSIFDNCYIEGDVDFIFGGGAALFKDCIINITGRGYVTAPSTDKDEVGFVFYNSTIKSTADRDDVYLMRPWRRYGKVTFISSKIEGSFNKALWSAWRDKENEKDDATFAFYDVERTGDDITYITKEDADKILSYF